MRHPTPTPTPQAPNGTPSSPTEVASTPIGTRLLNRLPFGKRYRGDHEAQRDAPNEERVYTWSNRKALWAAAQSAPTFLAHTRLQRGWIDETHFLTNDGIHETPATDRGSIRPIFTTTRNGDHLRLPHINPLTTWDDTFSGRHDLLNIAHAVSNHLNEDVWVGVRTYEPILTQKRWPWQKPERDPNRTPLHELVIHRGERIALVASTVREAILGTITLMPIPPIVISKIPHTPYAPQGRPATRIHEVTHVHTDEPADQALTCTNPAGHHTTLHALTDIDWLTTLHHHPNYLPKQLATYLRHAPSHDIKPINAFMQRHDINPTHVRLHALTH